MDPENAWAITRRKIERNNILRMVEISLKG
jgi:hypothetical protein